MDSPEEGLICLTCGDRGWTNAYIYCVTCLGSVIHRYCLQVMPETFDEFVMWHCEDCKPSPPFRYTPPTPDTSPPRDEDPPILPPVTTTPSPPYHLTSPTLDPSPSQDEDPPSLALVTTTLSPPQDEDPSSLALVTTTPSPPQDEDPPSLALVTTTPSPPQEEDPPSLALVTTTPSPPQEEDPPRLAPVMTTRPRTKRPNKRLNRFIVLGLTKPEPKSLHVQKKVVASLEPVKTTESQQPIEPPSDSDSRANRITPMSAELDTGCFLTKGIVKRKRDTARVAAKPNKQKTERSIEHSSCESSCTDAALKNGEDITHTEDGLTCGPDHEKLVSKSTSCENESNGCAYASQSDCLKNDDGVARPRLDPAWRGSFSITERDYDVFEGIRVHCSSKAAKRVHDEVSTFPSLLSFEMHSKTHLWPQSFLSSPPSTKTIAIYLLSGDTKNKRDFEQLVNDMIDEDLAMKTDSRNAQLLIFTSKVLPQEYWRFQGKYYLWGVFKTKKNNVAVANHSEKSEEETLKTSIESHSPQSPLCNYR